MNRPRRAVHQRLLATLALASLALASLAGCNRTPLTGGAHLSAEIRGAQLASVSRVAVRIAPVCGPAVDLTLNAGTGNIWTGGINGLPICAALFTANAFDANNHLIYTGSITATIVVNQNISVSIILQDTGGTTFDNTAPQVKALYASTLNLPADAVLNLQARVFDPDTNDPLIYHWDISGPGGGTFSAGDALTTDWSPPVLGATAIGAYTFTFTVTDSHQAHDSAKVVVNVVSPAHSGADITVTLNQKPYIANLSSSTGHLVSGQRVNLIATGVDPDGNPNALHYEWVTTCTGTFDCTVGSCGANVNFNVTDNVTGAAGCLFTVTVTDPNQGSGSGSIALAYAGDVTPVLGPQVTYTQSRTEAFQNEAVALQASPADGPAGYEYRYTATGGTLDKNSGCGRVNDTCAGLTWHPGPCASPLPTVTETVIAPNGGFPSQTSHTYTVNTCAPRGCQEARERVPFGQITNGATLVDPDGTGPNGPFTLYCDQTSFGGGWAQIGAVGESSTFNDGPLLSTPGTLLGPNNGTLGCPTGNALTVASGADWGFCGMSYLAGLGNDFTVRIDIEVGDGKQQHTFIRPRGSCGPGFDCNPRILGLNSLVDPVNGGSNNQVNTHYQMLTLSEVAFSSQNITWYDMPGEYQIPGGGGTEVMFFGYRIQATGGAGTPCNDPITGASQACHSPGGPLGSFATGTYSHAYNVAAGVPHAHGRRGQYFIKDRNVSVIPQDLLP